MAPGGYWIPENRSTRLPRTHICLDSEAVIEKSDHGETHTFRCAVTSIDRRGHKDDEWRVHSIRTHPDTRSLWEWVTVEAKPKERTVLVAHNLGYDLRITEAFSVLPDLGWQLGHFSLAPGATWLQWRRESSTLVMVDSMTWLPTSLQNLGIAVGRNKRPLPGRECASEVWIDRCVQDVEILRESWLRIIDWLKSEDLGNFRPTGAGQSWSAWRHKLMTHKVLVHDDEEVRAVERRAGWSGRAEAWRFGRQTAGPFTEWDFSCAYARIAQRCEVPVRLVGEMGNASLAKVRRASERYAVLLECRVETASPTVPADLEGRIVWPVGSFSTSLWENELQLALSHGARVEVGRAWVYERQPALAKWADWVLGLIEAKPGDIDPIVRTVAKHWARALIGRFGTRYPQWEPAGDARSDGASLLEGVHAGSGYRSQELEVGGRLWLSGPMVDHRLAAPQVMSWIVSQCRVDLWGAMNAAGLDHLLYVDTDSLIVDVHGDRHLAAAGIDGLRRKARHHSLEIVGTRRLIEDRQLKAAGVPRDARRVSSRVWSGESWESLQGALKRSGTGSVRVVERRVRLVDRDARRKRLPDGGSEPWRVDLEGSES